MAEFQDIIRHIQKLTRDKAVKTLFQKAHRTTLTSDEKKQLTHLLKERF